MKTCLYLILKERKNLEENSKEWVIFVWTQNRSVLSLNCKKKIITCWAYFYSVWWINSNWNAKMYLQLLLWMFIIVQLSLPNAGQLLCSMSQLTEFVYFLSFKFHTNVCCVHCTHTTNACHFQTVRFNVCVHWTQMYTYSSVWMGNVKLCVRISLFETNVSFSLAHRWNKKSVSKQRWCIQNYWEYLNLNHHIFNGIFFSQSTKIKKSK